MKNVWFLLYQGKQFKILEEYIPLQEAEISFYQLTMYVFNEEYIPVVCENM